MKLSIIIPVYNAEYFLDDCMKPIMNNLSQDIEILLLNDGSKDNSYSIMKKYECSNVRIFQHPNHGVSYTRNRGIKEAIGDYVMFVDSDDCLNDDWANIILTELIKNKDVYYFSKDCRGKLFKKEHIIENLFCVKTDMKIQNLSAPWSKVFKREFLLDNKIEFNEKLINGEDALFNLQCIVNTNSFECVSDSFYNYRIYSGSSTRKFNPKFFDANLEFFKLAKRYLNIGKIDKQKQNRYLSKSVVYSTYLYVYLVSTIDDKLEQKKELKRLNELDMKKYIARYDKSEDCSFIVNSIYFLTKLHLFTIALKMINVRNFIKKKKSESVIWEEN